MKTLNIRLYATISFLLCFSLSGALVSADSLDDIDTWKTLDEAKTLYEKGEFGAALQSCEKARQVHVSRIATDVEKLENFLLPAAVRKAGDDIGAVRAIFEKREDEDALSLLDAVLLNHPASFFGNSISKMIDWLEKQKAYPESDFLSGRIYEAEGENDIALSFYERAWENRGYLDIPDDRFVIAYRMADLARDSGNRGAQEKYLLLILSEDDLYGKPGAESPTLLAMMRTLETENTLDKFFSLYRHANKTSLKACRDLASFYLVNNRIDRALPVAVLSACSAVTMLSDTVTASDFSYEFSNLSDLMVRVGKNAQITRWAHDNGIWDSFLILSTALYEHGQSAQASSLWTIVAQSCPDPVASRRASKELLRKGINKT